MATVRVLERVFSFWKMSFRSKIFWDEFRPIRWVNVIIVFPQRISREIGEILPRF